MRAAIDRLRKTGKPVYAELTTAEVGEYLVATACDEIFMPASGIWLSPACAGNDVLQGAARQAGASSSTAPEGQVQGGRRAADAQRMSPPLRESLEAVVDDYYDDLVQT